MSRAPRHTLDQLLVLDAIERTGSFAAAARSLHRVPSAVSHAVARLEDAVGVAVFDRSGHRAVLTDAGRRILDAGREVLDTARRLDIVADGLQAGWEPTLQVVVDGALPMRPIVRVLKGFLAEDHPTRVRLDVEHRQGVIAHWQADDADLMLVLGLEEADGCVVTRLTPLPMRLVVSSSHPLGMGSVARAQLSEHVELLVRDSSPAVAEGAEAWFGTEHLVHFSDFPTKRVGLLEGLGFGWMPLHLVDDDLEQGSLRAIDLKDGDAEWMWQPMLVRRADRVQGPASRRFESLLMGNTTG